MAPDWQADPRLKHVDPRKILILQELSDEFSGHSLNDALPFLVKTNAKMKALGLSFNKQESDLMIEILTSGLSPQEKQKVEMLRNSPLLKKKK